MTGGLPRRTGLGAVRLVVLGSSRFLRRAGARWPRAHDRGGAGLPKRAGRAACQRLKRPSPRHAARSTEILIIADLFTGEASMVFLIHWEGAVGRLDELLIRLRTDRDDA